MFFTQNNCKLYKVTAQVLSFGDMLNPLKKIKMFNKFWYIGLDTTLYYNTNKEVIYTLYLIFVYTW